MAQCYCLRWNNYHSSVVEVMRSLLHEGRFLDVTLACDGRSLRAHRLVLAACSDYFATVLQESTAEHPIIFLRDVNFWELEAILDFVYNGQVNIMQEQLSGFIKTAEALQIKGLASVSSSSSLAENNTVENLSLKPDPDCPKQEVDGNNNNKIDVVNNNLVRDSNNTVNKNVISNEDMNRSFINNEDINRSFMQKSKYEKYAAFENAINNNLINTTNNNNINNLINNNNRNKSLMQHHTNSNNNKFEKFTAFENAINYSKKRKLNQSLTPLPAAHSTLRTSPDSSDLSPGSLMDGGSSYGDMSPHKGSSPLFINDTIHSLGGLSPQASISVAKALSFSKLVQEISSQASIASLKNASLPPHHQDLPPESRDPKDEPLNTSPPPPINTKDWASNKNEDGFPSCSLCGKVFKHQGSLVAHYQVHQQRTKCPVCQKVLSRHYHMKVHLLTVHKVPDSEIDTLLRAQCM